MVKLVAMAEGTVARMIDQGLPAMDVMIAGLLFGSFFGEAKK